MDRRTIIALVLIGGILIVYQSLMMKQEKARRAAQMAAMAEAGIADGGGFAGGPQGVASIGPAAILPAIAAASGPVAHSARSIR